MSRSLLLVLMICPLFLGVVQAQSNDMSLVKTRIRESLSTDLASVSTIQGYVDTLQTNGTWADIDYASAAQTARSPRTHLDQMKAVTLAADRSKVAADGKDLSFATVTITDRDGLQVPPSKEGHKATITLKATSPNLNFSIVKVKT